MNVITDLLDFLDSSPLNFHAVATCACRLEKAGFPVVFHVHDEVICEVPNGVSSAKELGAIMSEPIEWAPGLPLRADAYECEYYRKD